MRSHARARRRTWRWLAWLGLLGLTAALVLSAVLVARPFQRQRLVAAARSIPLRVRMARDGWQPAPSRARGTIRCAPARTVGRGGTLLALDSVPDGATASALFVWTASQAATADAELRALRAAAPPGALRELSAAGVRAVVLTTDGARLRAARRVTPATTPRLAVGGSRELCLLAG